ncbi:MAG: peptidogalycan biosysnthesis protein, partial [Methylocella sp.]
MSSPYTVHVAQSMSEIDAAQWDACANPDADTIGPGTQGPRPPRDGEWPENVEERFNPFITHAFLKALETSKSVGSRAGWT